MVMAWISIVEPYAAVLTFLLCSFHPAVRTGSRNTRFIFFRVILFRGHLPQTPSFRSAKQILVANFRYAAWARILSDRILCTLRGGRTKAGYNAPWAFLGSKGSACFADIVPGTICARNFVNNIKL